MSFHPDVKEERFERTVLELAGAVLRLGCASDAEHGSYNLKEGWVTDSCLILCSGPDRQPSTGGLHPVFTEKNA